VGTPSKEGVTAKMAGGAAPAAKMADQQILCHSTKIPIQKFFFLFGTELFFIFSKDFACNGRYILYNESTREKRRKKERKRNGKGYSYQRFHPKPSAYRSKEGLEGD
jgi:hypothetical protein